MNSRLRSVIESCWRLNKVHLFRNDLRSESATAKEVREYIRPWLDCPDEQSRYPQIKMFWGCLQESDKVRLLEETFPDGQSYPRFSPADGEDYQITDD